MERNVSITVKCIKKLVLAKQHPLKVEFEGND